MDEKFLKVLHNLKKLEDKELVLSIVKFLNEPKTYMIKSIVKNLDRATIYLLL